MDKSTAWTVILIGVVVVALGYGQWRDGRQGAATRFRECIETTSTYDADTHRYIVPAEHLESCEQIAANDVSFW